MTESVSTPLTEEVINAELEHFVARLFQLRREHVAPWILIALTNVQIRATEEQLAQLNEETP